MTQTIFNFKIESTNEKLTPRTGIAILGEYLKGMKLEELCNAHLPKAKRNNGYSAFAPQGHFLALLTAVYLSLNSDADAS